MYKTEDVTARLNAFCQYQGLSDWKMAVRTGMPQPTFSRYHNGSRTLTLQAIFAICNAFPELNPQWLVFGHGNMIIKPQKK